MQPSDRLSCDLSAPFIDQLHTIAGAGKAEGTIDAGNLLKPMLAAAS